MKYLLHNKRYNEYLHAQEEMNKILDEWIIAFQKTQPKATTYGDKVQSSKTGSKTEDYVIEVEEKHIYERLRAAGSIVDGKRKLLMLAEEDLRKSKNIWDIIYCAKWVDGKRTQDIYRQLDFMGMSYSTSQIYEIRRRIKAQIERE